MLFLELHYDTVRYLGVDQGAALQGSVQHNSVQQKRNPESYLLNGTTAPQGVAELCLAEHCRALRSTFQYTESGTQNLLL